MLLNALQIVAVVGIAAYFFNWRSGMKRRNSQSWGSLMARLRPDWNSRELNNPSLWASAHQATPAEKWEQIDGAKGLCAMFQNATVMLEMADYAARNGDAIDQNLLNSLRRDAMQIRVTVMTALARYAFGQMNESICASAFRAASTYTEMTTRMAQLLQANAAGMVPNFVAAM